MGRFLLGRAGAKAHQRTPGKPQGYGAARQQTHAGFGYAFADATGACALWVWLLGQQEFGQGDLWLMQGAFCFAWAVMCFSKGSFTWAESAPIVTSRTCATDRTPKLDVLLWVCEQISKTKLWGFHRDPHLTLCALQLSKLHKAISSSPRMCGRTARFMQSCLNVQGNVSLFLRKQLNRI